MELSWKSVGLSIRTFNVHCPVLTALCSPPCAHCPVLTALCPLLCIHCLCSLPVLTVLCSLPCVHCPCVYCPVITALCPLPCACSLPSVHCPMLTDQHHIVLGMWCITISLAPRRQRWIKIQGHHLSHGDPAWALPILQVVLVEVAAHPCVASQQAFLGSSCQRWSQLLPGV